MLCVKVLPKYHATAPYNSALQQTRFTDFSFIILSTFSQRGDADGRES